jgi:hypothetical protein
MGLKWSSPREAKNGELLILSSVMPETKAQKDELFNLWKFKKDEIKADGFQLGKNKFKDFRWEVTYFHKLTDTSREKNNEGVSMWKSEFLRKCEKWRVKMEKVREAIEAQDPEETSEQIDINSKKPKVPVRSKEDEEIDAAVEAAMDRLTMSKPAPTAKPKAPAKAAAKQKPPAAQPEADGSDFSTGSDDD